MAAWQGVRLAAGDVIRSQSACPRGHRASCAPYQIETGALIFERSNAHPVVRAIASSIQPSMPPMYAARVRNR